MTPLLSVLLLLFLWTLAAIVWHISRPFSRHQNLDVAGDDIEFYRAESRQLQADLQAGFLDPVSQQQHQNRLHRQLLALEAKPFQPPISHYLKRSLFIPLLLLFALLFGGLYLAWGQVWGIHALFKAQQQHRWVQQELHQLGGMPALIERFKVRVKNHPKQMRAWYYLGRLYLNQGQYVLAYQSLLRAYHLAPMQHDVLLMLAGSAVQAKQSLPAVAMHQLIDLAHQDKHQQSQQLLIWSILARLSALQLNRTDALAYWHKILAILPADSAAERRVLLAINHLQSRS